ncbi:hypothetical protein DRP07_02180 [Archaeoglobales archaeon]|nr:MAG: hypothetical protein DRP07_02180 [Archaeoglobales archaeon]
MGFEEYILSKLNGLKVSITLKELFDLFPLIDELWCNEECPLRQESEDGECYNLKCLDILSRMEREHIVGLTISIFDLDTEAEAEAEVDHADKTRATQANIPP